MNYTEICKKKRYCLFMKQKGKYILSPVCKLGQRFTTYLPNCRAERQKLCKGRLPTLSQLVIKRQQIIPRLLIYFYSLVFQAF